MSEIIRYKDFNEEEDRIYKRCIESIRSNVKNGIKFDLACEVISADDRELRDIIIDDALKIEVAESYFGKGLSLLELSKKLGVSMERLLKASNEMLEDVVNTSSEMRKDQFKSGPTTH